MKINKKLLMLLSEIVLAMLVGVSFFYGFQFLAADFMDFSHLWRTGPALIGYTMPLYVLIVLHLYMHTEKSQKKRQILFGNGIVLSSLSLISFLWASVYLGIGIYPMDGALNAMFPLDVMLAAFLSLAIGISILVLGIRMPKVPEEKTRLGKWGMTKKVLHSIFYPLLALIALYEFGGLLLGLDFANYDSPKFAYGIPAYIAMLLPAIFLLLREIFRLYPLENDKTRLIFAIVSLSVGIVIGVLPLFMLLTDGAYVETCFHPYYPLDYMGSLRVSLYLWSIPNVLAPFFFFLKPEIMKVLSSKRG